MGAFRRSPVIAKGLIVTRNLLLLFALVPASANILWAASPAQTAQSGNPGDPYYCPPGAKFCPVPGRDNTVYLDTHFGMDAATGEIRAYRGTVHPDEVVNNLTVREETLYASPPISVENRQVPWPGGAQHFAPAPRRASPDTAAIPASYPAPRPAVAAPALHQAPQTAFAPPGPYSAPRSTAAGFADSRAFPTPTSEVANQQSARPAPVEEPESADRKIPWWKGGMFRGDGENVAADGDVPWWKGGWWRNRNREDERDEPAPPRSASRSRRGGDQPPPVTPDDMWGDDDYNAFNPQFAGPDVSWQTQQQQYPPRQAPGAYQDPYAQPQGGFTSEPYTLPNSPPPSSPYQPGYVYPGTNVTYDNTYQGGYPAPQPAPPVYNAPTYGDPYAPPASAYGDPYSWPAPAPAPDSDPFASPPSFQAQPSAFVPPPPASAAPGGSPQFENAVAMVKESRFTEAKPLLLAETSSNPGNAPAWRWLGDCHYNLLELPQALDCYERAIRFDPNDYYAVRGQGFANLHRGHELWRKMMEEMNMGQREQAAATFSLAHDHYKKSLEQLGDCLRRAPNDSEAVYGEAMAAEGASRKLYSNAISYIKLGPENRQRAELFAENCLLVINKGVERANERAKSNPGEIGPRALLGGLYLRKAMLYHQIDKRDLALAELINSHRAQKAILDEIDKNNATALKGVQDCQTYWNEWGGSGSL